MSVQDLVPEVRSALGVSSSYDDEKIPALIRRCVNRLLRDYHFPKSVKRADFLNAVLDTKEFTLPAGFKKELEVRYYNPGDLTYSDPLRKRERFQLPYPSGVPYYYWLEGEKLIVDTAYSADLVGYSTFIWYESMDAAGNEDWLTTDFADSVFYLSVTRGCAEFRKPEVMQTYAPLWDDERTSLAIYLNELEWGNSDIRMREARGYPPERYPI
jgi:hypothetical protein